MTDKIEVSATCPDCHNQITWPEDAGDSTLLSCKQCNKELGTYLEFKNKAVEAVKAKIEGQFKDLFKRS